MPVGGSVLVHSSVYVLQKISLGLREPQIIIISGSVIKEVEGYVGEKLFCACVRVELFFSQYTTFWAYINPPHCKKGYLFFRPQPGCH